MPYFLGFIFLPCFLINLISHSAIAGSRKHESGSPDECTFIREALKQLPIDGGEFLIPAGHYTCHSPIVIDKSHITLTSAGDVTLKLGDVSDSPVIVMGDIQTPPRHLRNIRVTNIKINGNRQNQTRECWGGPCDSGGTSLIRNNGITIRGVTNGRIENVTVTAARSGGVVSEKGCYGLIINGLTATDNEFDGFAGYETSRATLSNMNLSHNRAAGISIDIRFNGNTIKDTKIEGNGDVGIFMRDSSSNLFENLILADNHNHGVFLAQTDSPANCANDNEFSNLSVLRSRGFGFRLNDACEGNRLSGIAQFLQNRDGCVSQGTSVALEVDGKINCEK